MIKIKFNRRPLCMGDDAKNGIYTIMMPKDSTLRDLIHILIDGGNGNDWPIPQTSEIGWTIFSNIGKLADISYDHKKIDFINIDGDTKLSSLGIEWVFGEREGDTPDMSSLARRFI